MAQKQFDSPRNPQQRNRPQSPQQKKKGFNFYWFYGLLALAILFIGLYGMEPGPQSVDNVRLEEMIPKLKEKFQSQTKLMVTDQMGDLQFEGQITDYAVTATAVGSDKAAMNRLTITVRVKFVNTLDEKKSYETTFSRYADFSSSKTLEQVQDALVAEIVEALIDDIFTKAVTNW